MLSTRRYEKFPQTIAFAALNLSIKSFFSSLFNIILKRQKKRNEKRIPH